MADSFDVGPQYPTRQLIGGTATRAVMSVAYITKPSGIYFEQLIPRSIYAPSIVEAVGLSYSTIFETLVTVPGVIGVQWTQIQKPDGTNADGAIIYVGSSSGNSSIDFTVALTALGADLQAKEIRALRAQLDKAEAV